MEKLNVTIDGMISPTAAREKLEAAGSLHWIHWAIVSLSFGLTFFAWYYTNSQKTERIKAQFDREAEQVVELIQERMQKYENALRSGVAVIHTFDEDIDLDHWKKFADGIDIEETHPGINGIGIIHAVPEEKVSDYVAEQRKRRPDFNIYPRHENRDHYPINCVIPLKGNELAIGLDVAHETNRFIAAKKARDTGNAQITGPITLVQDSGKTPGFLFYSPYYNVGTMENATDRQKNFLGMVYAPFVVKKLMEGVLGKEKRHVGIRLTDEQEVLYDEHVSSEEDFDPDPLFKRTIDADLYGRKWIFDIWSANSFRQASTDSQPLTILVGGILIDSLVILLFISISRSSQKALGYADSMTYQLEANSEELRNSQIHLAERARQLETSNAELEQFAYVASHDLQEPLRKISSYAQLIKEECGSQLNEASHEYLGVVIGGANRLKALVTDLLTFSRISTRGGEMIPIVVDDCLQEALDNLEVAIQESGALVTYDSLPNVIADRSQLVLLFQNLVGNAIKYCGESVPQIRIGGRDLGKQFECFVEDNGIGIKAEFYERVFVIFQRLHNRREYSGTGIGLAVCKRIVERFGGTIWLDSTLGSGSTFYFTLNNTDQQGDEDVCERELQTVGAPN